MTSDIYLGWHFLKNDRCLQWSGDKPLRVGDTLHVAPPLEMCRRGLHWSKRPIDALQYSPGSVVCYVEAWGETKHDSDKSVSEYRKILWMHDAERLLWQFLCDIAEDALLLTEVTHLDIWAPIHLRREWLAGRQITPEEWEASREASREASWAASRAASWAASGAASWAASGAASWAASWEASNDRLGAMLVAEMRKEGILQQNKVTNE